MVRKLGSLWLALALMAVAFSPPVIEAADHSGDIHFLEHLGLLIAGWLLAHAMRSVTDTHLVRGRAAAWWVLIGVGLLLVTFIPSVEVFADSILIVHLIAHAVLVVSGGLIGAGVMSIAYEPAAVRAPASRPAPVPTPRAVHHPIQH